MRRMIGKLLTHARTSSRSRSIFNRPRHQRLLLSPLESREVPAVYLVNALTDTGAGVGLVGDLRYCITQANASVGVPDTINFDNVATGGQTITLGLELPITDDVSIVGPTLKGPGDPNVTINTSAAVRHFNVNIAAVGGTASITGLKLMGGAPGGSGGSVLISSCDDNYNFTDTVFDSNVGANYGGAIGCVEPAALANYGTFNITRCKFLNNTNTANFGGAVAFNVLISGAGVTKGYTANITDTTFDGNSNTRNGGALFIRGYSCSITINNSTFSNNKLTQDGFGGTISILSGGATQPSTITVNNSTFSGNSNDDTATVKVLDGGCGGVLGNGGGATPIITFRNSTFTNNKASFSGGLFAASSGNPNITLDGCIVWNNSSLVGNKNFEGGTVTGKFSIIDDTSGPATFNNGGGNFFGATANPLLGPLAFNGGITQTHVPQDGSPARNAGDPASTVTVDQNGAARPLDGRVDMGSIESTIDTPIAQPSKVTNVTTSGGTAYTFDVTYYDGLAIDKSTIGIGEVKVVGPFGDIAATLISAPPVANAPSITATYQITPPGGSWDGADNGNYTITAVGGKVSDVTGKFVAAGSLAGGTFAVGISTGFVVNALGDAGVGAGTKGDIRYVINAANAAKGAIDSITFDNTLFSSPQTITLSSATELAITEGVVINGPGAANLVTISGGGLTRVFNLTGTGSYAVNISNVTVSGGNAAGDGGAFLVTDEVLNLTNVVVSGNSATGDGGAVVLTNGGGRLNAVNSTFSTNSAATAGGVVATNANAFVSFDGCTVVNNSANQGGAIDLNLGNMTILNSLLANNTATTKGGAISMSQVLGSLLIRNSTLSGNNAGTTGGAISTDHAGSPLNIRNSTITANTATSGGGGVFHNGGNAQPGNLVLVSSIIAGNTSTSVDVEVTAVTCTFTTSLLGGTGGGGVFTPSGTNPPVGSAPLLAPLGNYGGTTLTHGLLSGSPAVNAGSIQSGDTIPFDQRGTGFPRIVGGTVDIGAFEGVLPVPGGTMKAIPPIVSPGPTPNTVVVTYTDETGINVSTIGTSDIEILAPDMVTKLAITGVSVDILTNGSPRVATYTFAVPVNAAPGWENSDNGVYTVSLVAGAVSDIDTPTPNTNFGGKIGTFTVGIPVIYTVDKVSDDDDGITSAGELSLREAIRLANFDAQPSLIQFSAAAFGTPQTINMSALTGEMFITKAVTIVGPTAKLTIDAKGTGRIFNVDDDANSGVGISISNMALTNGAVAIVSGGAFFVQDDPLTLSNVSITNCTSGVSGGAIQLEAAGAKLTLNDCTLSGNTATGTNDYKVGDGGAINVFGNASLFINRSTLSGNSATGQGGAIYWTNGGSLNLVDSTLSSNTAAGAAGGGGLYFFGTVGADGFNVTNSTISGNKATTGPGGGIELNTLTGAVTVRNSTVTLNEGASGAGGIGRTGGAGLFSISSTIVAGNKSGGSATAAKADLSGSATISVAGNNNLVGVMDATNLVTLSGTGNQVGTTATPLDAKLGALANNGGSTQTHALLAGSPAKNAGNNAATLAFDQRGTGFNRVVGSAADVGAFEDQTAVPPPQFATVVIDDGTAQRSLLRSMVVNFDGPVTYTAGAFVLTRTFGGAGTIGLTLNPATGPASSVTITFNNSGTISLDPQSSLPDGKYQLTIVAPNVTGGGGTLDGNKNGVSQGSPTDDVVILTHRLFGDSNGDAAITATDFNAFRLAYGSAGPSIFDFDGIGGVTASDFNSFRLRYGVTFP